MAFYNETKLATVPVGPNDELTITIVIGNAQGGGWAYRLGGDVKGKGAGSLTPEAALCKGQVALAHSPLYVNTTVFDIQPQTNDLPATVTIKRSSDGATFPLAFHHSGDHGDTAVFAAVFSFQAVTPAPAPGTGT